MNAIRLRAEDLPWANALEDERKNIDAFPLVWVATGHDGDCFLIWSGSYASLAAVLPKGHARHILDAISGNVREELAA